MGVAQQPHQRLGAVFFMDDAWAVVLHHLISATPTTHRNPMAAINLICSHRELWVTHKNGRMWKDIEALIAHWPSYIAFKKRHRGHSLRSKLITWASARTSQCSFCTQTNILPPMHHIRVRLCRPCSRSRLVCLDAFRSLMPIRFQWLKDEKGQMRQFVLWRDLERQTGKTKEELRRGLIKPDV